MTIKSHTCFPVLLNPGERSLAGCCLQHYKAEKPVWAESSSNPQLPSLWDSGYLLPVSRWERLSGLAADWAKVAAAFLSGAVSQQRPRMICRDKGIAKNLSPGEAGGVGMGHAERVMCTYPEARRGTDSPEQLLCHRFSDWDYRNDSSLQRGANAKGVGQQGDHDWDSRCQTRKLCGSTRPVDKAYGFRKKESWYRDHYLARGYRDCGKEDRQYVDQRRRSGSHLYVEQETLGSHHLEEAGYHSDCESATAVGYWKPYGWYDGYPDADFGGSRNRVGRGMNYWREGCHYHAYRKRDNWSRGSHSLDLDYEKGDDGNVDCSRSGGRYCQKDNVLNMVHGDSPLRFGHCGIPEDCAVDDRNLSVAQEDQVSECTSSGQELESACELPRPQEVAENGCGETGMVAVQSRALGPRLLKSGCPRTRAGRSDWSLDWEEEGMSAGGTEAWQRNSCYRRTAPSALRHHIKGKQGR